MKICMNCTYSKFMYFCYFRLKITFLCKIKTGMKIRRRHMETNTFLYVQNHYIHGHPTTSILMHGT